MKSSIGYQFILFFLISIGLSACSSHKQQEISKADVMTELHKEIQTVISDKSRAEQVSILANELNNIFSVAEKEDKQDKKRYQKLNTNFDTTEVELKEFLTELNNKVRKRQVDVLNIRHQIKSILTSEEWQKFTKIRAEFVHQNIQWM